MKIQDFKSEAKNYYHQKSKKIVKISEYNRRAVLSKISREILEFLILFIEKINFFYREVLEF